MTKQDIPQITVIDREAFPTMWPPVNFRQEMSNRLAHYAVACNGVKIVSNQESNSSADLVQTRSFLGLKRLFGSRQPSNQEAETEDFICGFVGLWIMVDEAHIINIAVRESHRGKGIGELLLISSIEIAAQYKAKMVTLEVRASNTVAQNLYTKYGFKKTGLRKGYYTDNQEDAFIMTTDIITLSSFKQRFQQLKEALFKKLGCVDYQIT
jgi:ribosomal-protein-alanine N-acetyltransferase